MNFNFTVNLDNCEDGYDIQAEILNRATDAFIEQILGDSWDDDSLSYKLEKMIKDKVNNICNKDFKEIVCEKLAERLSDKIERTKQYKALISDAEIYHDSQIKTGLRTLIGELVKSEMKKVFSQ